MCVCLWQTRGIVNNKNILAKLLLGVELLLLGVTVYMLVDYSLSATGLLKRPRLHLTFQLLLAIPAILAIFRFIRIKGASDKMRKQAQDQRMVRSRAVELLIFVLLINILFYGLFFTFSPGRYQPIIPETALYIAALLLQFLLIGQMVTLQSDNRKSAPRNSFGYSIAGAVAGLVIYATYYSMMS